MSPRQHVVLCNGASKGDVASKTRRAANVVTLDYSPTARIQNIDLGLPRFVVSLNHVPPRHQDLLEIAAYVFSGDRWIGRGANDALEFNAWGRRIHFNIRVRDLPFWSRAEVRSALEEVVTWLTGDQEYTFQFTSGQPNVTSGLFDSQEFQVPDANAKVSLFSGGIDSLAGAFATLEQPQNKVLLISHRSGTETQNTQTRLIGALKQRFAGRVQGYSFTCRLKGKRAEEETQRSRSFLFSAIAYSLSASVGSDRFAIFENGITSLNLPKREGMGLARASRTTHPKSIELIQRLLSLVHGGSFHIETPFFWQTKIDVLRTLKHLGGIDLLDSSVSCSRTFKNAFGKTHCGTCSQCVDRRLASVAAGVGDIDHAGLYSVDMLKEALDDAELRTFVVDYLAQAKEFASDSISKFETRYLTELALVEPSLPTTQEPGGINGVYSLCRRHGQQIMRAAQEINDPVQDVKPLTLVDLISSREYLKSPIQRLCDDVCHRLTRSVPLLFRSVKPRNENDFNDKIDGLLNGWDDAFHREHPTASFARAKVIPDHLRPENNFLIESKYIRESTSPSKATEGLAADMFKFPPAYFKLFVVYDPHHSIADDKEFRDEFESRGNCRVLILR